MSNKLTAINNVSNNAAIALPYRVEVEIKGIVPILFRRWDCDSVESRNAAPKGSTIKHTDDVEVYLYRNDDGDICIPSVNLHRCISDAARFWQDPRSPRKTMIDLVRAGIIVSPYLISTGRKEPDFLDRRRVVIQRNSVTRIRPALAEGWTVRFYLDVTIPEYLPENVVHDIVVQAGKFIGVGDFRPTFGRFQVTHFEVLHDAE